MDFIEHGFTSNIIAILNKHFPDKAEEALSRSELLHYLNNKTKAANRGSKSRGSFGNLYAIYVLVEDYVLNAFHKSGSYGEYQGAQFTPLLKRMRELPFGRKLQNHPLNHRVNQNSRNTSLHHKAHPYSGMLRQTDTGSMRIC